MNETPAKGPCPRCNGKMLLDKATGDRVCLPCGHVSYVDPAPQPVPGEPVKRRRATHAGWKLS
jgi:hypothetical protein